MSETDELRRGLNALGVTWDDRSSWPTWRTCYMGRHGMVAAICGPDTMGGPEGMLEAWDAGQPHVGWMRAVDVLAAHPPKGRA